MTSTPSSCGAIEGARRHVVIAAETRDLVNDGVSLRRSGTVGLRQHDSGAEASRSIVKGGQQFALDFDELDAIGLLEHRCGIDAIEPERYRPGRGGIEGHLRDNGPNVAVSAAEAAGVERAVHYRLHCIVALGDAIERHGIAQRRSIEDELLARLPVLDIPREERPGSEPVGTGLQAGRAGAEEHHVDPAGEGRGVDVAVEDEVKLERAGSEGGRCEEQNRENRGGNTGHGKILTASVCGRWRDPTHHTARPQRHDAF